MTNFAESQTAPHSVLRAAGATALSIAIITGAPSPASGDTGGDPGTEGARMGDVYVTDERVFADTPVTPLEDLLQQLADAAGISLTLTGEIDGEDTLYARGDTLYRVLDRLLLDGHGYAVETDEFHRIRRLIIFSGSEGSSKLRPVNNRQRYLARQLGKRDDTTVSVMHETLFDRTLNDSHAKLIAIGLLADVGSERAIESLKAGIGDPDPQVRLATAKALYRLLGEEALPLVGQIYYSPGSASIRKDVAALVAESSHPLAQGIVLESRSKE